VNELFKLLTYLGDGYFTLIVVGLILFYHVKDALFILFAYVCSGGITQILKYGFFDDVNRPFFFSSYHGLKLKIVEGVDMHIHNSFPSGHSTAAFSLFICFALLSTNKAVKFACFIMALLVAFSRVYLSQHFFEDIYTASVIAAITATSLYFLFYRSSFSPSLHKLSKPVYQFFKKDAGQN
jgi:membrane-associated phospholipid phosphatase